MMKRSLTGVAIVAITITLAAGAWAAQKRIKKPINGGTAATPTAEDKDKKEPELASDPRIQKLQKDFVIEAARLAKEYEKKNDIEGARNCYEHILRVVPHHQAAEEALKRIHGEELNAERKSMRVKATEGWQDTGVNVIANRPIKVHAEGMWIFRMEAELSAKGMAIPEDLKDFNLGCLVGKIVTGGNPDDNKPFEIGEDLEFTPEASGRLLLRMYDSDPRDNKGVLNVEITGTFEKGK